MKNWFLTPNYQILDFQNCESFWIEEVHKVKIFCRCKDKIDWCIAEFENLEAAKNFMINMFEHLENEEMIDL